MQRYKCLVIKCLNKIILTTTFTFTETKKQQKNQTVLWPLENIAALKLMDFYIFPASL